MIHPPKQIRPCVCVRVCWTNLGFSVGYATNLGFSVGYVLCTWYQPARLERGVIFGVGQRKERKLCPKPLRALRIPRRVVLRSGSTFHGETALRLPPTLKECVALLVARTTCNEGVPAHREFLRARQTPVLVICILRSSLLGACMYRTRYQVLL